MEVNFFTLHKLYHSIYKDKLNNYIKQIKAEIDCDYMLDDLER